MAVKEEEKKTIETEVSIKKSPGVQIKRGRTIQVHEFKLHTVLRAERRIEGSPSPEGKARMQAVQAGLESTNERNRVTGGNS